MLEALGGREETELEKEVPKGHWGRWGLQCQTGEKGHMSIDLGEWGRAVWIPGEGLSRLSSGPPAAKSLPYRTGGAISQPGTRWTSGSPTKEGPEGPGEAPEMGWEGGRTAFPSPQAPSMKPPLALPSFRLGLGAGLHGSLLQGPPRAWSQLVEGALVEREAVQDSG